MSKSSGPKKWICPACGELSVVPVAFGFPSGNMWEAYERGEIILGGCTVFKIGNKAPADVACTKCDWRGEEHGDRVFPTTSNLDIDFM